MWFVRGKPITLIEWNGCMAHVPNVLATGVVLRRERRAIGDTRYRGLLVRWNDDHTTWEPMANVREVEGRLEVHR